MASREAAVTVRVEGIPAFIEAWNRVAAELNRMAELTEPEPPDTALGRCQVLLQCHRETGHVGGHEAREEDTG
jgi:hypothetical protein